MKKLAVILIILLSLSLLLGACDASDPDNLFGTTGEPSGAATEPTASQTGQTEPSQGAVGYQYGNMQWNLPNGNFMRYQDTVIFQDRQYNGPYPLLSYDMKTGEVSMFCKDATCDHSTDKCVTGGVDGYLEQYEGRLFGVRMGVRASDEDTVMELKDGRFEEIDSGRISSMFHGNGNLYVKTADASLLVYENGSTKPRMLMEEFGGIWNVVCGDYIYGLWEDRVTRVDLRAEELREEVVLELNAPFAHVDGEHIYYTEADDHHYLYRCDLDGSNPTRVLDKRIVNINFDDEYLYLVLETQGGNFMTDLSRDVYRVSKEDPTQVEIIASLPEIADQVFTVPGYDKVFVTTRSASEEDTPTYVVNIDGSGAEKLVLPEG